MEKIVIRIPADAADVAGAKTKVRALLAEKEHPSEIEITVPAGLYSPDDFVFGKEDCAEDCRIIYRTEEGAVIHGGVKIDASEWQIPDAEMLSRFHEDVRDKIRMANLSAHGLTHDEWGEVRAVGGYETSAKYDDAYLGCGSEVFCSDRRMTLARYPNGEYAHFDAIADVGEVAEFPQQNYFPEYEDYRNPRGGAYVIDRAMNARVKTWKDPDGAWMFGYFFHDWADSSTPCRFDTKHRTVFPKYVSRYGARAGALYYFYNVPEELDEPGEWYLDRKTGKLYFYPFEGSDRLDFSYRDKPLISCEGTKNMTFSGFTVLCTRKEAIRCTGDDMVFENLTVKNAAEYGIVCTGYRNTVRSCDISHTGRGGIILNGGERKTLTHGENRATNNFIHDYSEIYQTYQPGVSMHGVGNICDHNEICNTPHFAISYSGNEHLIEYNDIHDVVLMSNDAGAIYAGFDWAANGTVIRYNKLERVGSKAFHPAGIYWDDGYSGQTAYGNLLINVGAQGFLIGGGREHNVWGNVLIDCGNPIHYDDRNRDGFVHDGWAREATNHEGAPHWQKLKAVPYNTGIWAEKYPLLARVKTDLKTDVNDPDFPINASYSRVTGNVIIHAEKKLGWIADSVYQFSEIRDNPIYASAEEAGWNSETGTFDETSPVKKLLPDFARIPVDEIGRK